MDLLKWIDNISIYTGKIFRWAGLLLSLVVLYEVAARYLFNRPTMWVFDTSLILYSMLFIFGATYVLWEQKHIKVDVLYNRWSPRTQRVIDAIFYLVFFFPFVCVMIWFGSKMAYISTVAGEISNSSTWGEPIYLWKWMIPVGFSLLLLQGIAEFVRTIQKLRRTEYDS